MFFAANVLLPVFFAAKTNADINIAHIAVASAILCEFGWLMAVSGDSSSDRALLTSVVLFLGMLRVDCVKILLPLDRSFQKERPELVSRHLTGISKM